jgi:hypothetical protein
VPRRGSGQCGMSRGGLHSVFRALYALDIGR